VTAKEAQAAPASDKHKYGYAQVQARGVSRLSHDIEYRTSWKCYGLLDVWMSPSHT
jgi:GMP synthase (glutamine-hydrolysing)